MLCGVWIHRHTTDWILDGMLCAFPFTMVRMVSVLVLSHSGPLVCLLAILKTR